MSTDNSNVGIAFALSIGAGAATALGAAVVFFPSLVKYADRKTLAAALGFSAGVMIYVSFVEIFKSSKKSFEDASFDENDAYMYATFCFFGGVILMMILNRCVASLLQGQHHHHSNGPVDSQNSKTNTNSVSQASNHQAAANNPATDQDEIAPCACCSDDPLKDLETLKIMADEMEHGNKEEAKREELDLEHGHSHEHSDHCVDEHDEPRTCGDQIVEQSVVVSDDDEQRPKDEDARLLRMSINTALAIALHNFPEGLATFVGTLNNPKVGAVLAVAIAIHNIPEGLCVAMPIYYATGNRRKAFMWAVLSGASEPFAALLGWAVLANSFSSSMYAILFGLVAGMMVTISARELLPTAHRYDPEDSVATYSFILGMGVMALSLILFVV